MPKKQTPKTKPQDEKLTFLLDHYSKASKIMDTRRTRKNGWNDIINAYMAKLPTNWPYTSMITVPLIRTTILEKNARLINSKLQGRLVPREGGDMVKAKIQNALLDYQWDAATCGGSMIEKVAKNDQYARIFGASFAYVYWDNEKNSNEIKVCDPRDILIDWSANHIRNAKWVQYREYTTLHKLEEKGYDVKNLKSKIEQGDSYASDLKSTKYEDIVFQNRGIDTNQSDLSNPVLEVVTEWTDDKMTVFLPRYGEIIKDGANPYKHGKIPFAQLRYYPLVDDIMGESEVESVISLQRAANAMISGFIDQSNISMRPPVIVDPARVRIETIEYGPGARWVVNDVNGVREHQPNTAFISTFNSAFPSIIAQFNTAMGNQSQGVNALGKFDDKTATEVRNLSEQSNNWDQSNQVYLSEFLKDIMMMWVSNNKQYLFDDPNKKYFILKIIGKANIQAFQQMQLEGKDIPDFALNEIAQVVQEHPDAVSPDMISNLMTDMAVPTNPVDTGEEGGLGTPKLNSVSNEEADLYVEEKDFEGVYDYIPDVRSMSQGANAMQQQARSKAYELILANPLVQQLLLQQGETLKVKDLLINILTDAGERDAEGLFQSAGQPGQPTGAIPGGQSPIGASGLPVGNVPDQRMGALPPTLPTQLSGQGMAQPQGLQG